MKKPVVFITRQIHSQALDQLSPCCEVEIWPEATPPPHAVLVEKANQVAGILPF